MPVRQHLSLFLQAVGLWAFFWVVGLPDYYQQYSEAIIGSVSVILSVLISFWAVFVMQRGTAEQRRSRAFWYSIYFSIPLAILDTLYCGVYLGRGHLYLVEYWYLSVFYLTIWLTMYGTAWLFNRAS
jgi:hypothetical protein